MTKISVLHILLFVFSFLIGYLFLHDDFNQESLKGQKVVITGASRGVGEQLAYQYARLGANTLITARREAKLQEVVNRCLEIAPKGTKHAYFKADMNKTSSYLQLISEAEKILGGIDVLILNHITVPPQNKMWDNSTKNFEGLDHTLRVNFRAYVHLASHAIPLLEKSKGRLTVVSSFAGKISAPKHIEYSASKFVLEGFFNGLRQQFNAKGNGVSITLCILGFINTENARNYIEKQENELLSKIVGEGESPVDTAYEILKGTELRQRDVFFPAALKLLVWIKEPFAHYIEQLVIFLVPF